MTALGANSAVNHRKGSHLAFAVLVVVLMALGLYAILVAGPALRATAQESLDRTLADENRAFCEKFGMRAGTSQFVACSVELTAVRKNQADRDSESGML